MQDSVSIKIINFLVSVISICLVLYLKKILLLKIYISYCLVLLNSLLFFLTLCVFHYTKPLKTESLMTLIVFSETEQIKATLKKGLSNTRLNMIARSDNEEASE